MRARVGSTGGLSPLVEAVAQTAPRTGASISRGTTALTSAIGTRFRGKARSPGAHMSALDPPLRGQHLFGDLRDSLDEFGARRLTIGSRSLPAVIARERT